MIQFYFLSIFFNLLAGFFLIAGNEEDSTGIRAKLSLLPIRDDTFCFILGILSLVTALLKILSPRDVLIVGDLVPALAGFAAGFILVFDHYKGRITDSENDSPKSLASFLVRNKRIVGYVSIAAAVLHFLFPEVLFL